MTERDRARRTLEVAEDVARTAEELGIDIALIGAMAMAAHRFVRATTDLDLATAVDPSSSLQKLREALVAAGFDATVNLPDAQDPLGGVLNVDGEDFNRVQVVNFLNPWNGLAPVGQEAVATAKRTPGERLRVVDLPHLIALKLYAGGRKSKLDILELLERNPEADHGEIRAVCQRFGLLPALEKLLAD